MAKGYPTKIDRRKMNLTTRNKRLARKMKSMDGLMYYFQQQLPEKMVVNGRHKQIFKMWRQTGRKEEYIMEVFTDRMDASLRISLYEYKIIRNPKTDKCVICTNTHLLDTSFGNVLDNTKPKVRVEYITFDDVYKALEDVSLGYFDYIGRSKTTVLAELDADYLTAHIFSLEQYCGWFKLTE